MFLVDTDVISESRKGERAHPGVQAFLREARSNEGPELWLSVVSIGELRRGVELIRHRGDAAQADRLERWMKGLLSGFADRVLGIDSEIAQLWGRLRVPHPENPLDKQIAATALIHGLTLVTRNKRHFETLGVRVLDPFARGR